MSNLGIEYKLNLNRFSTPVTLKYWVRQVSVCVSLLYLPMDLVLHLASITMCIKFSTAWITPSISWNKSKMQWHLNCREKYQLFYNIILWFMQRCLIWCKRLPDISVPAQPEKCRSDFVSVAQVKPYYISFESPSLATIWSNDSHSCCHGMTTLTPEAGIKVIDKCLQLKEHFVM